MNRLSRVAFVLVASSLLHTPTIAQQTEAKSNVRTANNGQVVLDGIPEVPESIVNDLNRYQNIRAAGFNGWTPDGKGMYVTTRFGDVTQIHRVDQPGGARHQLTFFKEPIGSVTPIPASNQLGFSMDQGGNEAAQLFALNPSTGNHRLLSDGESRNGSMAFSRDGKQMACYSTRRNGASNDVWVTDVDTGKARLAFASPDGTWWGPTDFSADNANIIVQQYVSVTDSRLHLLNIESGKAKLLAGSADAPTRNLVSQNSAFAENDEGVFYVTDASGEFAQLAYLPLKDNAKPTIITKDIQWDVEDFVLSSDRMHGAFIVNEGGLSRLYLFNPVLRSYRPIDNVPVGVISSFGFSPDNTKLAITINSAQTPSDVFVLSLAGDDEGKLKRWTYSEVGGLDTDSFALPKLIRYPTFDKVDGKPREIPAFIYKPDGDGPFPVVVSIHGGPESQFRPRFSSTYQLWAKRLGAAIIAPNVRGSNGYGKEYVAMDNGFKREDSVKDIGALLDWIATQSDLDQDRVVVYGGSYGGYMVLASATKYSDRLKAAVDIVGISNFVTFLKNTQDYRRDLRRVEYGDERDPKMNSFLQQISPTNNVEKIKVPMLVMQGQNDPRVPVTEAEQIVAALRNQGNDVWYMNALNEGHGYRKKENRDLFQQVVVMFLRKHLDIK